MPLALSRYVAGTSVPFTDFAYAATLSLSSSGGGLPGRPQTRKSRDACLIFALFQRLYLPIHSALANVWLAMARSTSCLVAAGFKFSLLSSA